MSPSVASARPPAVAAVVILLGLLGPGCSDDVPEQGIAPYEPTDGTVGSADFVALDVPPAPVRSTVVARPAAATDDVADRVRNRLEQLFGGLEDHERREGLVVPWPDGAAVLDEVTSDGSTVVIDFSPSVTEEFVASPGTGRSFYGPVVETIFLEQEVERVAFRVAGSVDAWNEWWQGRNDTYERDDWRRRNRAPDGC
jgi:hypothetical protein